MSKVITYTTALVAALGLLAAPGATAGDSGSEEPLPIHRAGRSEVQNWVPVNGHHAFGFYTGAPAEAVQHHLPPGVKLANCLEHKFPQSDPAPGTADIILEAYEVTIPEHPEWGVVRLGAIATCVHFPDGLGYPAKDMATSGYQKALGLPTAPAAFVLMGWTDNRHMKEFMEGFGLTPIMADITIEDLPGQDLPGAAWTFDLSVDGTSLYSGVFPSAQRNPDATGEHQYSPCLPVKQQGVFVEWPKGSDTFAIVDFQNAVKLGTTEVNANTYACLGGHWTWSAEMEQLIGPNRPSALAGSQPNDDGAANRLIFNRYRAGDGNATTPTTARDSSAGS